MLERVKPAFSVPASRRQLHWSDCKANDATANLTSNLRKQFPDESLASVFFNTA